MWFKSSETVGFREQYSLQLSLEHSIRTLTPWRNLADLSTLAPHCFNPVRQVAIAYRQSAVVSRTVQRRQFTKMHTKENWFVLLQKVPLGINGIAVIFGVLSFRMHDFLAQFDSTIQKHGKLTGRKWHSSPLSQYMSEYVLWDKYLLYTSYTSIFCEQEFVNSCKITHWNDTPSLLLPIIKLFPLV